jgi:hypothetical protein
MNNIQKYNICITYTDLEPLVVVRCMVLARKSVAKNEKIHQNFGVNRLLRTDSDLVLSVYCRYAFLLRWRSVFQPQDQLQDSGQSPHHLASYYV